MWPIAGTLKSSNTWGQNEFGCNSNEVELNIPKTSRTRTLSSVKAFCHAQDVC